MLNKEQQEVVDSTANKILVLAGAGTGKTHCMLARIQKLVESGVSPSEILVLTFTNSAAYNMAERFKPAKHGRLQKLSPEFKTFHAFCYGLITSDPKVRTMLGYSKVPSIILDTELQSIRKTVKTKYNVKLSDSKLNGTGVCLSRNEKFQYDLFRKCLRNELLQQNKITFDIICYEVCELFVENHPSVQPYLNQYKYIFVDEFQDTDPKQWRFVQSFKDAKLYVIGDSLQSLYSFRNADSSIIKSLASDKNWTTYRLHRNYRSTKQICDFANENSLYADTSYRVEIDSERDGREVNVIKTTDSSISMYKTILERCKKLGQDQTLAVLCRTNAEAYDIREYLKSNDISVDNASGDTKLKMKLMRVSLDDYEFLEFLASNLPNELFAEYQRVKALYVRDNESFDISNFLGMFQNTNMSPAIKLMNKIHEIMWNTDYDYLMMYDKLLELLGIPYQKTDLSVIEDEHSLINAVCEAVDKFSGIVSNVYVGTIHSSKGLEYDEVHLPNVGGKTFRLTSEDNNNVYYVGITRAKTDLYVYLCR